MLAERVFLAYSPASEAYGAMHGTCVPRDMALAEPLVRFAVDFAVGALDGVESGALCESFVCSVLGVPTDMAGNEEVWRWLWKQWRFALDPFSDVTPWNFLSHA